MADSDSTTGTDPESYNSDMQNTDEDEVTQDATGSEDAATYSDEDYGIWEDIDQVEYVNPGLTDVEDLSNYCPGGFHPVSYGNVLDGRYEVVSKLGHGGFGTVWLCLEVSSKPRDDGEESESDFEEQPQRPYKWRAVKIVRAERSPITVDDWPPLQLRNHLEWTLGLTQPEWEAHNIMLPLEHFWLEGPNGRHLCEVSAVHGAPLSSLWEPRMPGDKPPYIKHLLHRAGKALGFLHKNGICHGDFTPGNMLIRVDSAALENISHGEMVALLEERHTADVEVINAAGQRGRPGDHAPLFIHENVDLSSLPLLDEEVAIVDFGECFWAEENGGSGPPEWSGIPAEFAAPEALYNCGVGPASDVWAFACGVVSCLMSLTLFSKDRNRATGWYEATIGEPVPERYRKAQVDEIKRQLNEAEGVTDEQRQWAEEEIERLESGKEDQDKQAHNVVARAMASTALDNPIFAQIALERIYRDRERYPNGIEIPGGRSIDVVQYFPRSETGPMADLLGKIFRWEPEDRIDIDAVVAHKFFKGKKNPRDNRRPSAYDIMTLGSKPGQPPQGEKPGSGTSTPFVEDPSENGEEPPQAEEKRDLGKESDDESDPDPQPPEPVPYAGLHPVIYRIGRFLDNFYTNVNTQRNALREWEPTRQEITSLILGLLTSITVWLLVVLVLLPWVQLWLSASDQQCPTRNTLLVPMTLRSSTSTYSRGFLAFSAPKVEGDINSTCTCVLAQGFNH